MQRTGSMDNYVSHINKTKPNDIDDEYIEDIDVDDIEVDDDDIVYPK